MRPDGRHILRRRIGVLPAERLGPTQPNAPAGGGERAVHGVQEVRRLPLGAYLALAQQRGDARVVLGALERELHLPYPWPRHPCRHAAWPVGPERRCRPRIPRRRAPPAAAAVPRRAVIVHRGRVTRGGPPTASSRLTGAPALPVCLPAAPRSHGRTPTRPAVVPRRLLLPTPAAGWCPCRAPGRVAVTSSTARPVGGPFLPARGAYLPTTAWTTSAAAAEERACDVTFANE